MSILRYCRQERIDEVRDHPQYAGRIGLASELTFFEGGEEGNRLILKKDSASEDPPGAILRVIGRISRTKHSLRPQGTYNPSNKLNGDNVKKAKLRFNLLPPKDFGFATVEFEAFIENLTAIHDNDLKGSKPLTVQRPFDDKNGVKVMHRLVIPRQDEDDDIDLEDEGEHLRPGSVMHGDNGSDGATTVASNILNDSISLENWPVPSNTEWRKELESVKDTHDICPLQAFTSKGELIHPSNYVKKLAGAIVDLSFTLVHYNFGKFSRMCLYVTELHVLISPRPLPGSATRAKKGIIRK